MKRKKEKNGVTAVCQLRNGDLHPFGAMRGFIPLGGGEERVYREMREAIPVLDAAVGKMVRLCGGFHVHCRNPVAQQRLEQVEKMPAAGRAMQKLSASIYYLAVKITSGELPVHLQETLNQQ